MTSGMHTYVVPVTDLTAAKAVYGALLGVEPSWDQPYYVGFDAAGQHLGLDPNGHQQGMTGPQGFWDVDDIAKAVRVLVEAGATQVQSPKDVGGGKLIATVRDADGNIIGLVQPR